MEQIGTDEKKNDVVVTNVQKDSIHSHFTVNIEVLDDKATKESTKCFSLRLSNLKTFEIYSKTFSIKETNTIKSFAAMPTYAFVKLLQDALSAQNDNVCLLYFYIIYPCAKLHICTTCNK